MVCSDVPYPAEVCAAWCGEGNGAVIGHIGLLQNRVLSSSW